MHLSQVNVKNFRRLTDTNINLDGEITIFVGANNSGKTSVAHAINFFINGARDRVSFHDISACRWTDIDAFERGDPEALLPEISLDLWFEVDEASLYRAIDLLPSLDWQGNKVGVRISFSPKNQEETRQRFREKYEQAQQAAASVQVVDDEEPYVAQPQSLREFLKTEIQKEYEFKYFVLDGAQFSDEFEQAEGYEPQELLKEQGRTGRDIILSLIKVDLLHAQRHLTDHAGGSRSEELSRHLSRYYERNLERHEDDHNAIRALATSEHLLNQHLAQVFDQTLQRLESLGYPGLTNPSLTIKSALNPATLMSSQDGTHVYYSLDNNDSALPDKYNGLGFKNLIYMVVELLDIHAQWVSVVDNRPPLHLIFVEEPEAHLHAQLQQVFVKKVLEILAEDACSDFHTQMVLTTHSPHMVYERGFRPIRYFRRERVGVEQTSKVLNLSEFYQRTENPSRDFLERYLKLTHCDLFFADAAILVEGNVERLVMPQMIAKVASGLNSRYVCILEVGGAFGHLFQSLIEFLGITTLIVTDLDSIHDRTMTENDESEDDHTQISCPLPEEANTITSNQMLIQWIPGRTRIDELLELTAEDKTLAFGIDGLTAVRVTYPGRVNLIWGSESIQRAGRTLEVAFAFDNLEWTQQRENTDLKLRIHSREAPSLEELVQKLHNRVHRRGFKKTDFALALLTKNSDDWNVPQYITEGLQWLESNLGADESQPEGEAA
ncbi:MAG: ATP-dependent nuclease [bacterium]